MVVRVRDTGIGIAPEMLPRVFDMFVQVGATGATPQGGLGIGLSLVRTLVEMHGGTIAARSEGPGHGQRVRRPAARPRRRPGRAGVGARPSAAGRATGRRAVGSWSWTTTWTPPGAWPGSWSALRPGGQGRPRRPARRSKWPRSSGPRWSCSTSACPGWTATRSPGGSGAARVRGDAARGPDRLGPGVRRGAVQGGGLRPPPGQAGEPGGHPRTAPASEGRHGQLS